MDASQPLVSQGRHSKKVHPTARPSLASPPPEIHQARNHIRGGLSGHFFSGLIVLLCHNLRRLPCAEIGPTQQGTRDSVATRATINLRRIVAMEFGTWRSGRNGGAPRSISFGNCNFREQPGGTSS